MLGQCLRRWTNINTPLGKRFILNGYIYCLVTIGVHCLLVRPPGEGPGFEDDIQGSCLILTNRISSLNNVHAVF